MIQITAKTVTGDDQDTTHQGRVCFFSNSSSISYNKPHFQKNTPNHYKISCYPNFRVKNDQIILYDPKPNQTINKDNVKIEIERLLPPSPSFLSDLNNSGVLKSVGQILVICLEMYDVKDPKAQASAILASGTCFVTKLQASKSPQVVSVMHIINQEDMRVFDFIILANFSEENYVNQLSRIIEIFNDQKLYETLTTKDRREKYFISELKKVNKDARLIPLQINKNFLKARRYFLDQAIKSPELIENLLLDPLCQIKPSPSVDLALFDVDSPDLLKNIPPLVIADLDSKNKNFVLVMFASPGHKKITTESEYSELFTNDSRLEQTMSRISLDSFIHYNKSASYGTIHFPDNNKEKNASNPNVIFYGSTTVGASGGPLLDHEGKVVAVNFGNFSDKETSDQKSSFLGKASDNQFDVHVKLENKKNFQCCKNFNLAISMRHPLFQMYLDDEIEIAPFVMTEEEEEQHVKPKNQKRGAKRSNTTPASHEDEPLIQKRQK